MDVRRILLTTAAWMLAVSGFSAQNMNAKTGRLPEASSTAFVHFSLDGYVEYFKWEETVNGRQFVKEDGPLFGIGAHLSFDLPHELELEGMGKLFLGQIDYDGGLQSEEGYTPYTDETRYSGAQIDGHLGLKLAAAPQLTLTPQIGAGFKYWLRELGINGDRRYGYDENWFTLYLLLALKAEYSFQPGQSLSIRAGARAAVYNREVVTDLYDHDGDVHLEPGEKINPFAELTLSISRVSGTLYYEQMNFSKSDTDSTGSFLQPKSEATIIGGRLSILF